MLTKPLIFYGVDLHNNHTSSFNMKLEEKEKTTNLVELFYSADQVRVAGGVLKVHVIWEKQEEMKITFMLFLCAYPSQWLCQMIQ